MARPFVEMSGGALPRLFVEPSGVEPQPTPTCYAIDTSKLRSGINTESPKTKNFEILPLEFRFFTRSG